MKVSYKGALLTWVAAIFILAFLLFIVIGFVEMRVENNAVNATANFVLAFGFLISGILAEVLKFLKMSTLAKLEKPGHLEKLLEGRNENPDLGTLESASCKKIL